MAKLKGQQLIDHLSREHSILLARQQVATARVNAVAEQIHKEEGKLGLETTPLHVDMLQLREDPVKV